MKRKTLAIPIRLVNFSDTSQILTLFTREQGVVEAIAKGAHRERNPFQGPFDLGVLWEVVFAERAAERGLSILTEGTVVEGFREVRGTWVRWAGAAFVLEYLRAVGTAGEPAEEMFDLAVGVLEALGRPGGLGEAGASGETAAVTAVLSGFEARALRILGLSAPPVACSDCGRPWSRSDRPVFFSAQAGGILCGKCHQRAVETMGRRGLVVPGKALRILEDLAEPTGAAGEAPASDRAWRETEPGLAGVLRKILDEMRTTWLERRFLTVQYVEG